MFEGVCLAVLRPSCYIIGVLFGKRKALFSIIALVLETMTNMQCRAARALLRWTQEAFALKASVSALTIRNFEGGRTTPNPATQEVMRAAFEKAGIEFDDDGRGVRLKRGKIK